MRVAASSDSSICAIDIVEYDNIQVEVADAVSYARCDDIACVCGSLLDTTLSSQHHSTYTVVEWSGNWE